MIIGHARQKSLHRHLGHEARHLAAEAEMLAGPEAEVSQRPAVDVVDVGVGKLPLVPVGRSKGERDLVTDAQGLAVQSYLARDRALETLCRRVEAQRFL